MNKFSPRELLSLAISLIKRHFKFILGLYLLLLGVYLVPTVFEFATQIFLGKESLLAGILVFAVGLFSSLWLFPVVDMGSRKIHLDLVDNNSASYSTLFQFRSLWLRYLGVSVLAGLISGGVIFAGVSVGLITWRVILSMGGELSSSASTGLLWAGLALGALTAITSIVVSIRLAFSQFFIVDQGLGAMDSVKKSWAITHRSVAKLFLLGTVLFVLNILGALPLALGLFVTIPITSLSMAGVYRKLVSLHDLK